MRLNPFCLKKALEKMKQYEFLVDLLEDVEDMSVKASSLVA